MATDNEKTRNDGYLVASKNGKDVFPVSFGKNLIERINGMAVLNHVITENDFNDSIVFRGILSELDNAGYYVYQLTRL
ncbi:MAG: hypothetical protein IKZ59_06460 [Clostridia bacterium]|nr:hypothetical protein [Clostridia bacterium]